MPDEARGYLIRQLDTAWKLTNFHLDGLTTEECLWRPAHQGLHVLQVPDGRWRADWPDHEGYDVGPPSIAWLTWHLGFWWSMVLDHSFGDGALVRENVMSRASNSSKQKHRSGSISQSVCSARHGKSGGLAARLRISIARAIESEAAGGCSEFRSGLSASE